MLLTAKTVKRVVGINLTTCRIFTMKWTFDKPHSRLHQIYNRIAFRPCDHLAIYP